MRKKAHVWEEACSNSWLLLWLLCEFVVFGVLSSFFSPPFIRSDASQTPARYVVSQGPAHYHVVAFLCYPGLNSQSRSRTLFSQMKPYTWPADGNERRTLHLGYLGVALYLDT